MRCQQKVVRKSSSTDHSINLGVMNQRPRMDKHVPEENELADKRTPL